MAGSEEAWLGETPEPSPDPRAAPDGTQDPRPKRPPWAYVGVAAVAIAAVVGGNVFGLRDRLAGSNPPAARPVAVSRQATPIQVPAPPPQVSVLRSYPWWQVLTTFQGSSPQAISPQVTIDPGAIQWRVKWTCKSGQLMVRASTEHGPVVDTACPASGFGYGSHSGPTTLSIVTGGAWQIEVDQQVDVPLVEPPTPAMTGPGATVLATASLYNVDQSGSGQVTVYQQADGSFSLRLAAFFVTPNVDLEIRFSPLAAPHSTTQYLASPSVLVAPLDVTTGSINFGIPAGVDPLTYRSLDIWCPTITSLYAAATLTSGR